MLLSKSTPGALKGRQLGGLGMEEIVALVERVLVAERYSFQLLHALWPAYSLIREAAVNIYHLLHSVFQVLQGKHEI